MNDSPAASAHPKKRFRFVRLFQLAIYAIIGAVVLIYAGTCAYMYSIQTNLIYAAFNNPISIEQGTLEAKGSGLIPWEQTTPGASGPQGFVRPDFANPAPRGTIVLFHGNGEFAWMRAGMAEAFRRRGFRTFLYEYPGYCGRPGTPSEKVIVPDAQALIRSLDAAGYGPVYVWGISLGSGVAAAVCGDATLPVHGLALSTPWDNLPNVGLALYPFLPVRLILVDQYDSIANLQKFSHSICVIRSEHDEIIPPPLTLNLFAHLPEKKKLILLPGVGHNDWPDAPGLAWWDDALDFIAPK